jgi:hypothetical protein
MRRGFGKAASGIPIRRIFCRTVCENVAGQDLIDVSATHRHRVFPMQIEIAFSARKIWLIASVAVRTPLAEPRSVVNVESSARLSIVLAQRQ